MTARIAAVLIGASYFSTATTDLPVKLARHYRAKADRVGKLATDAVLPRVRDALLR
jgi:hypothetical protein